VIYVSSLIDEFIGHTFNGGLYNKMRPQFRKSTQEILRGEWMESIS
ncbi:15433_t:CDS:2, partial [Entrophospora sp. SA101]